MNRLPLNALRAFECCARHANFTAAALELNVTPGGISRHVRLLEDELGVQLFVRGPRGVALTGAGRDLAQHVARGLGQISDAVTAVRRQGAETTITVTSAPSFATRWLMPRLDRFLLVNPGVQLRLDTTAAIVDLARDDVDLAIRHGRRPAASPAIRLLAREEVFPVCSPQALAGNPVLREPADLLRHRLLHADWWATREGLWPDWPRWLAATGVAAGLVGLPGPRFGLAGLAMQQASLGLGIALGSDILSSDDRASGALVAPFGDAYRMEAGCVYYLISRGHAGRRGQASELFCTWLLAELQDSRPVRPLLTSSDN